MEGWGYIRGQVALISWTSVFFRTEYTEKVILISITVNKWLYVKTKENEFGYCNAGDMEKV